ncbi:hypothetical protein Dimus_031769 [Dionaea muscipula]
MGKRGRSRKIVASRTLKTQGDGDSLPKDGSEVVNLGGEKLGRDLPSDESHGATADEGYCDTSGVELVQDSGVDVVIELPYLRAAMKVSDDEDVAARGLSGNRDIRKGPLQRNEKVWCEVGQMDALGGGLRMGGEVQGCSSVIPRVVVPKVNPAAVHNGVSRVEVQAEFSMGVLAVLERGLEQL